MLRPVAVIALVVATQTACAVPLIGALTLNELNTSTSVISSAVTGKGLADHAVSMATDKNCALLEFAFRSDRAYCEDNDAEVTRKDFKGIFRLVWDLFADDQAEAGEEAATAATAATEAAPPPPARQDITLGRTIAAAAIP